MRPDGEFSLSISSQSSVDIYAMNFQATPWLETTFRYSIFDFTADRSYELKARLFSESRYIPEVSIGLRDGLGTGIFSSEYLVANKSISQFDISLGLGWGRFAERATFNNPFVQISDRFSERDDDVGLGGTLALDSYFSGPNVGVFGGATYHLPEHNLRFIAEYNTDTYQRERRAGVVDNPSPLSYGVEWDIAPDLTLAASYQFGEQLGLRITSRLDTQETVEPYKPTALFSADDLHRIELMDPELFSDQFGDLELGDWHERLGYDLKAWGLSLLEASRTTDNSEATIVIANNGYGLTADALDVALDLVDKHLPRSFTGLNIVLNEYGFQPVTLNLYRPSGADSWVGANRAVNILPGREVDSPFYKKPIEVGNVSLNLGLGVRLSIFDPDDPLRQQINLRINASTALGSGWVLRGSYIQDIDNNFDEITRQSDSVLPRVRSDIVRYLQEGESGIDSLFVERRDNLSSDVYYRLYGGILEEQYSGLGGEILYQPFRSRLAYGFSANWVKQRDFDKSFSHLDYNVVTAFASIYWATPWYNYDVAVHAGRYLARDIGATFEVRRTFDNGWVVGAWATLTDVPFDDFGEGSFDKGIFLRVPFQTLLGVNTRQAHTEAIRSIQRDGGQFLEGFSGRLWHDLRAVRYDAIYNGVSGLND